MTNSDFENNILDLNNCRLCPRRCGINRKDASGFCKAGKNAKIARATLHFWEEPCISGSGGSGTVFFCGCSLKCVYCQNFDISHGTFGKEISPKRLGEIFLELQAQGAENINLVSPTHFCVPVSQALEYVKDLLCIPVVYNTGGYETKETLEFIEKYTDVYLTDIKYFSKELSKKYSGAEDYFFFASNAAKTMVKQKKIIKDEKGMLKQGVVIRHLVLPGCRKDSFKILDFLNENFEKDDFILSLMSQYVPTKETKKFSELDRKITSFEYNSVVDYALKLGFDGFMQEKSSADKKYTPPFDLTGV